MEGFSPESTTLPNSYRLLTADANFIRNAGFMLSLLATFFVIFAVVIALILALKNYGRKYEIWYPRIAVCVAIGAVEFGTMSLFYWSLAHLMSNRGHLFSRNGAE
jgi:hypothetical protein